MDLNPNTTGISKRVAENSRTCLFILAIFMRPLFTILTARHKKTGNTFPAYILEIKVCERVAGVNR